MNQLVDNKNRYNKQKSNGQCPKNNMPKRIPSVRKKFSRFHYILYYKKKNRPRFLLYYLHEFTHFHRPPSYRNPKPLTKNK